MGNVIWGINTNEKKNFIVITKINNAWYIAFRGKIDNKFFRIRPLNWSSFKTFRQMPFDFWGKAWTCRIEPINMPVFFQPKSLNQLLLTVDNLELLGIYDETCPLCIDDIFNFHVSTESKKKKEEVLKKHAYFISLLANLAEEVPVFITNNAVKVDTSKYIPFNEYLLSKWVQCSFFVRKKDGEILLEDTKV